MASDIFVPGIWLGPRLTVMTWAWTDDINRFQARDVQGNWVPRQSKLRWFNMPTVGLRFVPLIKVAKMNSIAIQSLTADFLYWPWTRLQLGDGLDALRANAWKARLLDASVSYTFFYALTLKAGYLRLQVPEFERTGHQNTFEGFIAVKHPAQEINRFYVGVSVGFSGLNLDESGQGYYEGGYRTPPLLHLPTRRERMSAKVAAWKEKRDLKSLETTLLTDRDAEIRWQAAWRLEGLADKSSSPALRKALFDNAPGVRQQATSALGTLHDEEAVPAFLVLLSDVSADVRSSAAYVLSKMHDSSRTEVLATLMRVLEKSPLSVTAGSAAQALGFIGPPAMEAVPKLIERFPQDPYGELKLTGSRYVGTAEFEVYPGRTEKAYGTESWTQTIEDVPAAAVALYRITGVYAGKTKADWLAWWRGKDPKK